MSERTDEDDELEFVGPGGRDDDEGLFSRDINGQLVRLDAPTESDYGKSVDVKIDGRAVKVPLAEPLKDAQGNVVVDIDGRTTPRYTTIYDAALRLVRPQGRRRGEDPHPGVVPSAAHGPGGGLPAVRGADLRQKRGKRAPSESCCPPASTR
jgi:hypothetical protein